MAAAWALAAWLFFAQTAAEAYRRATALFESRDLEGARAAVEEALRLDPKLAPALIFKAKLAIQANRLDEAQTALESALAVEPSQRQTRFLLGFVFYLKNDFARARSALASADPDDARAALYRGLTEEALNQTEAAAANYERAMKLDAASAEPRVAYARLLFALGKMDRAEMLVDQALKLAPSSADALYEKGRCLLERGDAAGAAEFGERALAAPDSQVLERRIRYLLMRAYLKSGKPDMAARHQAMFDRLPNPLVR